MGLAGIVLIYAGPIAEARYFAEGSIRRSPGAEHLLDLIARHRPAWHADALCKEHPEVNFFDDTIAGMAAAAAVCGGCAVVEECRAAAFDQPEKFGVWGGLTPRERGTARRRGRVRASRRN